MCRSGYRRRPRGVSARGGLRSARWRLRLGTEIYLQSGDLIRFLPEIILTIAGTLLMVLDPLISQKSANTFGHLTIVALIAAMAASVYAFTQGGAAFGGM